MPPRLCLLLTLAALAAFPAAAQALPAGRTLIASGTDAMDAALPAPVNRSYFDYRGAISDDGTHVAFSSDSDGLVPDDDDRFSNVYVKDRVTGSVTLVSRRTGVAGGPSHGDCHSATISDDGKRVAFQCAASLDPADGNDHRDVYVRDVVAQTTMLASRATNGAVANGDAAEPMISGDGKTVAFTSLATNLDPADAATLRDVYTRTLGASPVTKLVSRANGLAGAVGNANAFDPTITDDGTHVAFATHATNLTSAVDGNGHDDIYVRDVQGGTTELASAPDIDSTAKGDGDSRSPVISGKPNGGQYYVAFLSLASNLGSQDANGAWDVYRRSLVNGATVLVTRTSGPAPHAIPHGANIGGISDDGMNVAFATADRLDPADPSSEWSSYVAHLSSGTNELLSRQGDAGPESLVEASPAAVSGDGKAYAIGSEGGGATPDADPVRGDGYVRDLHSSPRTLELVTRPAGTAPFVNDGADAWGWGGRAMSADGSRVVFSAVRGRARYYGVWVRDLRTGALILASRADGAEGGPDTGSVSTATISADGNRVAWITNTALDPADGGQTWSVYVRDLAAGRTILASRADGAAGAAADNAAYSPALDADGDRVAFATTATNLGDGDADVAADVHLRDLAGGRTRLVSGGATGWSDDPAIDAAGTHVAFTSSSTDLGDGDKDALADIHLRDLSTGGLRLISATPAGVKSDTDSWRPAISDDGSVVAFMSTSAKLIPGANGRFHVIVRDLAHGTLTAADRADGPAGALSATDAGYLSLSGDGTKVAWAPNNAGLPAMEPFPAPGLVRVRDIVAGTTTVASRADGAAGAILTLDAILPSLNRDGHCVLFFTASPLAAGAGSDYQQAYVRTLGDGCAPPLPVPPGGGEGPDTTAPVLSGVRLTRTRFAVGARATARVASRRRRGTVLRFRTSEAGTLRVNVQRRRKGAFRPQAKLIRSVPAGSGRLAFSGRIGRHALRRGRYRLAVTVTDAAGNRSRPVKVRFRIVRAS